MKLFMSLRLTGFVAGSILFIVFITLLNKSQLKHTRGIRDYYNTRHLDTPHSYIMTFKVLFF